MDPTIIVGVAAALLMCAAVACYAPAWKVAVLDPATVLREEGLGLP